jgi:acyl carrier protein phosphodiesterase
MNYLGHLSLNPPEESELMAGNFMADLLRIQDIRQLPSGIMKGIQLHREIDHYTDKHPVVKEMIAILRHQHQKYTPVVIDVAMDFFIGQHWESFHAENLADFSSGAYSMVSAHFHHFPPKAVKIATDMIYADFLSHYTHVHGLQSVFERLEKRARFPSMFHRAASDILYEEHRLTDLFKLFYTEALANFRT